MGRRVSREGGKRAKAPFQETGFILSKLRFRDRSAILVENPEVTIFEGKFGPPPGKILDTPLAAKAV